MFISSCKDDIICWWRNNVYIHCTRWTVNLYTSQVVIFASYFIFFDFLIHLSCQPSIPYSILEVRDVDLRCYPHELKLWSDILLCERNLRPFTVMKVPEDSSDLHQLRHNRRVSMKQRTWHRQIIQWYAPFTFQMNREMKKEKSDMNDTEFRHTMHGDRIQILRLMTSIFVVLETIDDPSMYKRCVKKP